MGRVADDVNGGFGGTGGLRPARQMHARLGRRRNSVRVEELRLGGLAEPPADHVALEEGRVASR